MAKVEITRETANDVTRNEVLKQTFQLQTYFVPAGTELTFVKCDVVQHRVNGNLSQNGTPIIVCHKGDKYIPENEVIIYLRSFLKIRKDFKENPVILQGSFNEFVVSKRDNTTYEKLFEEITKLLKKKKLRTLVTDYLGFDKNGDVRTISVNSYDIV